MFTRAEKGLFGGYERLWTINFVCLAVFVYSLIIKSKAKEIGIPFIQQKTTTNLYSSSFVILIISILFLMSKYVFPRLKEQGKNGKYLLILLGFIGILSYRTIDKFKIKNQGLQKITEDMTFLEKDQIERAIRIQNDDIKYSLILLIVLLLVLFFVYKEFIFGFFIKMTIQISCKVSTIVFGLIVAMNLYTLKQSSDVNLQYSVEFEKYKLIVSVIALIISIGFALLVNKTKIKIPVFNFKRKKAETVDVKPINNRDYLKGKKIAVAMNLWNEREDISFYNKKTKKQGSYSAYTEKTKQGLIFNVENAPVSLTKTELMSRAESYKIELGATVIKDLDNNLNKKLNDKRENSKYKIEFIIDNPLNKAWIVKSDNPIRLNEDDMTVYPYRDIEGNIGTLSFKEVSGMVIGGLPGSGKTAGMTSFMLPLALSEKVEMTVIDGKGGDDWDNFSEVADLIKYETNLIDGTNNLEVVVNRLKSICADAENRKKVLKKITGKSNFWNSKPSRQLPFKVVVFDEVQTFLNETGRSKEERESITLIHRLIAEIVTKYRSLGFCVIMATQKPSADNIPTDIRDNTSLRLSFRVATSTSEYATLGSGDELGSVSATNISQNNKGVGVIADDKGNRKYVRFGYMDEQEQEKLVSKYLTEIE